MGRCQQLQVVGWCAERIWLVEDVASSRTRSLSCSAMIGTSFSIICENNDEKSTMELFRCEKVQFCTFERRKRAAWSMPMFSFADVSKNPLNSFSFKNWSIRGPSGTWESLGWSHCTGKMKGRRKNKVKHGKFAPVWLPWRCDWLSCLTMTVHFFSYFFCRRDLKGFDFSDWLCFLAGRTGRVGRPPAPLSGPDPSSTWTRRRRWRHGCCRKRWRPRRRLCNRRGSYDRNVLDQLINKKCAFHLSIYCIHFFFREFTWNLIFYFVCFWCIDLLFYDKCN